MPSTKTGTPGDSPAARAYRPPRFYFVVASLLVLAAGLWLGTWYYDQSRNDWIPLQHGTAQAGQRRIVAWVASEFARSNAIAVALSPLADANRRVADSVAAQLSDAEAVGTWLVGASGILIAGRDSGLEPIERDAAQRIAAGDPHTILARFDSSGAMLSVIAAAPRGRAIVRRIRADSTLYPLADWAQTTTETAQLAIIAHRGDSVFNLTPLRNPRAPPGAFRRNVTGLSPLWHSAVTSPDTAGWFTDERGVPVLATTLAIPPLPWSFIVQVDEHEVMEQARQVLKLAAALAVALIAFTVVGVMAASRTRRIRRLRRAVDEEHRFHALVAAAMDAIIVTDSAAVIAYANPAAESLFGVADGGLIGAPLMRRFTGQSSDGLGQIIDELRARGSVRRPQPLRFRAGDRERIVELTGGKATDTAGALLLSFFFRDVTEQHKMHEELRQSQQAALVGRLAAGLAHDFNNALQVVTGNVGFIPPDSLPEVGKISLEEVIKGADRLAYLTAQLLSFGREQTMRPRPLDLVKFFRHMEPELRLELDRAPDHRWTIECVYPAGVACVDVDPVRLDEAVRHVVENAGQAMPHGGAVTITIAAGRRERIAGAGGAWAITIADTGVGMNRAVLEKAREPFFSTQPRAQAQGLGLAIVDGFAAQSGGDLTIESESGAGTRVTIWLPAAPREICR
jgi:PAS domain S-box-containing protein